MMSALMTITTIAGTARILAGMLTVSMLAAPGTAIAEEVNWSSLNLNEAQMGEIQRAEQEWRSVSGDLMPQIERDREELKRLLNSDGDPRRILELQQRISTCKQKLDQTALQTFLKKKQHLSPEQKQKLQELMRSRGKGH